MALANTSTPAGLEIRESEDVRPSRPPAFNVDRMQRVALDELIRIFNTHRNDYRAVVMRDGVTVIRPVDGTLPFLDEPSSLRQAVTITGVMAAATRLFGLTGPILNSLGQRGEDIPVVLNGSGGRTVIDMLNQIVAQAPGRAWMVTTRDEQGSVRATSFGFIEANGSRRTQPIRRQW